MFDFGVWQSFIEAIEQGERHNRAQPASEKYFDTKFD